MSNIIRSLVVRVGADTSEFQSKMKNIGNDLKSAGKQMSSVGKNMTKYVTLPLAGLGYTAFRAAADFEQGMANIRAVSGATGDDMAKLSELAMKMGKDTKYSATEAASGIEELIKAGVSIEDILNGGLDGALNLATAGEIELADAAEIASTVLNSFKSDALNVSQAADILAGAANASATNVQDLKFGLAMSSAVASGMGMTFEDTATALAVFAQNGLKGSDAGTSLKSMLLNLSPTGKTATTVMERLGLITEDGANQFYDAAGNMRSLAEISDVLKVALANLTAEERQVALKQMFGTDAIRAANILFKEGADGVSKMNTEMGKVKAADVAAEKMNTLNGSIEQLRGSFETLMIGFGNAGSGPIKGLIDSLNGLLDSFSNMSPAMQQSILLGAGMLAAFGPVVGVIGKVTATVGTVTKAVGGFGKAIKGGNTIIKALGLALGPGAPVMLGIAAVALGAFLIIKNWSKMVDFVKGIGKAFTETLDGIKAKWESWKPGKKDLETTSGTRTVGYKSKTVKPLIGHANGGIFTRPTQWGDHVIGEKETEALIPLSKLENMMSGGQTVNHTGTITVRGVNSRDELIGVTQILARDIAENDRRMPNRTRLVPI